MFFKANAALNIRLLEFWKASFPSRVIRFRRILLLRCRGGQRPHPLFLSLRTQRGRREIVYADVYDSTGVLICQEGNGGYFSYRLALKKVTRKYRIFMIFTIVL